MADDSPTQSEGVVFSSINPVLDEISYPITATAFVERYGDRELERTNADPISVRELFGDMGKTTFESPDGVRQMLLSQMPSGSGGRTHYSDRGGTTPTETDAAEAAATQTSADAEGDDTRDNRTT
ncbi:hypothetical protein [Haloarcula marina]|uniref:DUF5789 family protein n=1 Tax=Haloarcula marina TaxID=2961574 RepID=UPI0020B64163|nr:hypothetical protein [Halomicroarcula marina]